MQIFVRGVMHESGSFRATSFQVNNSFKVTRARLPQSDLHWALSKKINIVK
jgi:hypothetical protein